MTIQSEEPATEAPAAPSVVRVDWAPVPRVNLLPPEILADRSFRSVRWRLVLVVLLTVLLGAGGVVWSQSQVNLAKRDLDLTLDGTAQLNQQVARYADVPKTLAAVDAAKAARETALSHDVLWYRFLNDVALATSSSVSLTSMSVAMNSDNGKAQAGTVDPLAPAGIGAVTVKGTATSYPAVVAWLRSIAGVSGLAGVTLDSVEMKDSSENPAMPMTFAAHLVLTDSRLSHRYDRKAG